MLTFIVGQVSPGSPSTTLASDLHQRLELTRRHPRLRAEKQVEPGLSSCVEGRYALSSLQQAASGIYPIVLSRYQLLFLESSSNLTSS